MAQKAKTKSKAQAKAKRKSFLEGINKPIEAKKDFQGSLMATGLTLLVGVVGGGFAGAAIGKPSLLTGALVTGAGHYSGSQLATIFGLGMMTSGGFLIANKSVSGLDGLDGAKERMKLFSEELKQKFFLDKLPKKKAGDSPDKKAMGEVQYFNYPELAAYYNNNANLDRIEAQISSPAEPFNFSEEQGKDYQTEIAEMIF
jgi:hypothetical protein